MTSDDVISQITTRFTRAIDTLDALSGRNGAASDFINAAHQCWSDLLAENERLNAILELKRASEERLMAALAESERTSEALSKYLEYLSVENSRLRARMNGTVDE